MSQGSNVFHHDESVFTLIIDMTHTREKHIVIVIMIPYFVTTGNVKDDLSDFFLFEKVVSSLRIEFNKLV